MDYNTLTVYSVRRRGVTMDIKLIKDYLDQSMDNLEFRFFTKNEISKNSKITQMIRLSREEFSKKTGHALCIDESMPKKFLLKNPAYCRMYVAEPFDFLFREYMSKEKKHHNKMAFSGCTHIFTGIPLMSRIVQKNYNTENLQMIENVPLIKSWDILHSDKRQVYRKKLEYFFPYMKGKKILALLMKGDLKSPEGEDLFPGESLRFLADHLDEDIFILFNSLAIVRALSSLPGIYREKMGYTGAYMTESQLVYIADVLVTNTANHGVDFAGTGKPMFCYHVKENGFTRFMKEYYPGLCLKKLEELVDYDFSSLNTDSAQKEFHKQTVIDTEKNPFEIISSLFLERV